MAADHNPPLGAAYSPDELAYEGSRALSYGLREVSRRLLGPYADHFRGLTSCGYPAPRGDWVSALLVEEEGRYRVRFGGLMTCGSPWACPVCAPTLAEERGEALARAVARLVALGYRAVHVVLTVRHTAGQPLVEVFGALTRAWRWAWGHRRLKGLLRGVAYARSVEATFGRHGWHPHIHALLLVPPGRDPWALEEPLWEVWSEAVLAVGWEASSRAAYRFQVVEGEEALGLVSRYTAKGPWGLGQEVAGGPLKEGEAGLTPFQLLGAAYAGGAVELSEDDPLVVEGGGGLILREFCGHALRHATRLGITPEEAAYRWVEWAEATRGRKALTMSRALTLLFREALEAVEAEEASRVPLEVVYLARRAYVWLLRSGRLAYWVHVAEALGSLVLACELLGLVEEEWRRVVEERGPPPGGEGGG